VLVAAITATPRRTTSGETGYVELLGGAAVASTGAQADRMKRREFITEIGRQCRQTIVFAVFRLITSSNLVGCCTGMLQDQEIDATTSQLAQSAQSYSQSEEYIHPRPWESDEGPWF
jgi:hypothetical protein